MKKLNYQHKIIIGDSRNMIELDDESAHLVITSPPYWQLKDYGNHGQIGYADSYETYINNLNLVWNECYRVLFKGCKLCINIGDQFARSFYYGRYKVIPIRSEIIKFCETIGFDYLGAIIWQKKTTINTSGGAIIMGSYPFPRNGILKIDYEFILIFKKHGKPPKVDSEIKKQAKLSNNDWNRYFSGHWRFPGEKQQKHLAMFPVELPKRLIKMYSFPGEVILDPFLGSGTTMLAARDLKRNSIGFEVNPEFMEAIEEKLDLVQTHLFSDDKYEIVFRPSKSKFNTAKKIKSLPYIFHDPIKFEKKQDPKKNNFGSKIDNNHSVKEEYFSVKKIINPCTLTLNNGITIRLIGIKEKSEKKDDGIIFLLKKTKGQKVFLKFDDDTKKYDSMGNLLCYLYLKNKTFINAHLLKEGLASIDNNQEFKKKQNFEKYSTEYSNEQESAE